MIYDMTYDIIVQYSIRSAAALRRPRCGSGLAVTLPRLCRPGSALAEPFGPDPLRLCDRHHPGAAPAAAPHPDVHLVEPADVAPVPLRVGGGVSKVLSCGPSPSSHMSMTQIFQLSSVGIVSTEVALQNAFTP